MAVGFGIFAVYVAATLGDLGIVWRNLTLAKR